MLQPRHILFFLVGDAAGIARLFKYTTSTTDPHSALRFAQSHFPVLSCDDPENVQPGALCNGTATCGMLGRSQFRPQANQRGPAFSLHMVNSSCRPGGEDVATVERHFDARLEKAEAYDEFMDIALVLMADLLNPWLQRWLARNITFFPLAWKDDVAQPVSSQGPKP